MNSFIDLAQQQQAYNLIGFSEPVGFGARPALLVIDMCVGITETGHPLSIPMDGEIGRIQSVLQATREARAPVVFTTVGYAKDQSDGAFFVKKIPHLQAMVSGTSITQLDARLAALPDEQVIEKQFPSAFAGTSIAAILTAQGVDTLLIVGNSTSGCVRATVVDGVSLGYRVAVIADCVADRIELSHDVSLFDMGNKYCDVRTSNETTDYLNSLCTASDSAAEKPPKGKPLKGHVQ